MKIEGSLFCRTLVWCHQQVSIIGKKWVDGKELFSILKDNKYKRTSLVSQWLRIHLPMKGTRVQALVREDPTCRRTTKPTTTEPAL